MFDSNQELSYVKPNRDTMTSFIVKSYWAVTSKGISAGWARSGLVDYEEETDEGQEDI